MKPWLTRPLTEVVDALARREISPVELMRATLERIEETQPTLNAFTGMRDAEALLADAREAEERIARGEARALEGVPLGVKDLEDAEGLVTSYGSVPFQGNVAERDSVQVERLRAAGAIVVGKTNSPEFGYTAVTKNLLFGVTRNPWDLERSPGGSSGGTSAAIAGGVVTLGTASDGGGSVRIPAAFTGIFGLKPSFGRVPAYPLSPFGTLAHLGPMTRTVEDAALMLTVLAEPDPRDWYALPAEGADYTKGLDGGVEGLKIAFSPTLGGHRVAPEIAALVAAAAQSFVELGATVEEAEPELPDCAAAFRAHWYAGAASLLSGFSDEQKALLDPGLLEIAAEGAGYTLLDYLSAVRLREAIGITMNRFHEDYDLLLTPCLPIAAFEAGLEEPPDDAGGRWVDWTPFTYPFNLSRQPAASVPCGLTAAGLPAGLQIVGPLYADALVLRAARAYERTTNFRLPRL